MSDCEKELIIQLKRGSEEAFERLFHNYKKQVFLIAWSFTKNKEDALEIVQETFLKVFKNIKAIKEDGNLKAWINMIAKNLSIDYYRKMKKETQRYAELDENTVKVNNSTPFDKLSKSNLSNKIKQIVLTLSKRQQSVFILKHFQGLKLSEIATELSISEGTVKKLHFRAMETIRKELGVTLKGAVK
jgi:RNA polymerase sigma-70 factor (ECF subfamily)